MLANGLYLFLGYEVQGFMKKASKRRAPTAIYSSPNQLSIEGFESPFERHLNAENGSSKKLADREFIGEKWLGFLNEHSIRYHIRIRNNFKVFLPRKQKEITVWHLFNNLNSREFRHYQHIVEMHGQLCYLSATKTVIDGKVEFLILVSFNKPQQALEYYRRRWNIETLFKFMKSSGFNIEDTHVTDLDRLEKLFMLTMIACLWCYKVGDYIHDQIRPIKIKKHQRKAVSIFKYGLDYIAECLLSGFNKLNINLLQFLSCT